LYVFIISLMRASWPFHLILLDLITLMIFHKCTYRWSAFCLASRHRQQRKRCKNVLSKDKSPSPSIRLSPVVALLRASSTTALLSCPLVALKRPLFSVTFYWTRRESTSSYTPTSKPHSLNAGDGGSMAFRNVSILPQDLGMRWCQFCPIFQKVYLVDAFFSLLIY
jgi:hypothetical protein